MAPSRRLLFPALRGLRRRLPGLLRLRRAEKRKAPQPSVSPKRESQGPGVRWLFFGGLHPAFPLFPMNRCVEETLSIAKAKGVPFFSGESFLPAKLPPMKKNGWCMNQGSTLLASIQWLERGGLVTDTLPLNLYKNQTNPQPNHQFGDT